MADKKQNKQNKSKTKLTLDSAPRDRSLQAYKDFIQAFIQSMGFSFSGDKKMTEEQWVKAHAEYWEDEDKSSNPTDK